MAVSPSPWPMTQREKIHSPDGGVFDPPPPTLHWNGVMDVHMVQVFFEALQPGRQPPTPEEVR